MLGWASVRAAVAAGDAKGAHSDGGHCCPSDRLMNIIIIVMAAHSATVGRVEAVGGTDTADWLLLPVVHLLLSSYFPTFIPFYFLSSVLHLSPFVP